MAGNVGTPLASLVGALDPGATVVCEVSSFQLEDASEFAPDTALLLNLEEDHLDRHGTFESYRDAKLRIFARQSEEDVAVVPPDIAPGGPARRVTFGPPGSDLELVDEALAWRGEPLLPAAEIRLRGAHNLENAMGAAAAALASGVPAAAVSRGAAHLRGRAAPARGGGDRGRRALRERLEGHQRGRRPARHRGLRGRRARDPRRQPQGRRLRGAPGRRERALPRLLPDRGGRPTGSSGTWRAPCRCERSGDLETALRAAAAAARPGEVVLLSPACASYDQYRDYEERGEQFRRLVTRA